MACEYGGVVSDKQFVVLLSFDEFDDLLAFYHGVKSFFHTDEATGHYINRQRGDGQMEYVFDDAATATLFKLRYG